MKIIAAGKSTIDPDGARVDRWQELGPDGQVYRLIRVEDGPAVVAWRGRA